MAKFTVRVELHHAAADDYEQLHTAMEGAGFSMTIKSNDGKVYHLPTAEYRYASKTEEASDVRDKAFDIAKTIKPNPAVLVTEASSSSWRGLKEVK